MVLEHILVDMTIVVAALSVIYIIATLVSRHRRRPQHRSLRHEKPSSIVYMNGIASCFPQNSYRQSQMRDMFIQNYCGGPANLLGKDFDFINRVFTAASIETCFVQLPENRLFSRMARDEYTLYVKSTMLAMGCEAARAAMANIPGFDPQQITHIVFGTMTATTAAPSMDVCLAQALGLETSVKRLNVEAMGCLTGFRLVGLCRDMALQSEDNVILLIVSDIRSALGNQMTPFSPHEPIDKSNVIVAALFRDSCGAAIFSQRTNEHGNNCSVMDHRTSMIPNTFELGRLSEFADSSIHLYLDKQLPYAVFDYLPQLVHRLLDDHRINITVCQFAVHTGGPKIIRGIQQCLALKDEQVCASWFVMKYCGNLSGSSNLVVVEHFYRWRSSSSQLTCSDVVFPDDFSRYQYIIGLSFGPGIGVECVLFELEWR